MSKKLLLLFLLFIFAVSCGDDDSDDSSPTPATGNSDTVSACKVGDILKIGETCSLTADGQENFFLVTDGRGCLGTICSGDDLTVGDFSAEKQDDGSYKITSVP